MFNLIEKIKKIFDVVFIDGHIFQYTYGVFEEFNDPESNCGFGLKKIANRKSAKEAYRLANVMTRIFPKKEILVVETSERRII